MQTEKDQIIVDAKFCVNNPDVLHTPGQHRTIIQGLLNMLAIQSQSHMPVPAVEIHAEPIAHVGV